MLKIFKYTFLKNLITPKLKLCFFQGFKKNIIILWITTGSFKKIINAIIVLYVMTKDIGISGKTSKPGP